jgi:hypothetical protein
MQDQVKNMLVEKLFCRYIEFMVSLNQLFKYNMMKRYLPLIAIFIFFLTAGCENLSMYSIILDNQSDYQVTVELYTGATNEDGSMLFDDYSVSPDTKDIVKSDVSTVYVDNYTPSANVSMDVDDNTITFTNR